MSRSWTSDSVALCRDSYSDTRAEGPRLWGRALNIAFPARPSTVKWRADVWKRFDDIREYRNRVAHHEPLWDRNYLEQHELIIDSIGWMSPKLSAATRAVSPAIDVFSRGPSGFRAHAEQILSTGPGLSSHLDTQVRALSAGHRPLVASLIATLSADPAGDPVRIASEWLAAQGKSA